MTWIDFERYAAGELLRRAEAWEQARWIGTMIHNVNCDKVSKQRAPQKILPLWPDRLGKVTNGKGLSDEEKEEMLKDIQK